MSDDPDDTLFDPRRPKLGGGPFEPGEQSECELDGKHYPEGSVVMVEGRPATCTQGRWIGVGDDPPFKVRHPNFLNDSESGSA